MKRPVRYVLLGIVAAALVYASAPALSQDRYLPPAVDFEQELGSVARLAPAVTHAGKRGPRPVYRSAVLEAPQRFDLAGLAGEMRELELRGRESDGEWSEWVETANGDPVYFGGADELQLRTSGWRPSGTVHYVNVSGTTTGADSLLTKFRETVNSAFISASSFIDPEAGAAPIRPPMVTRAEWGANRGASGCTPRSGAAFGKVKAAVVHHTVNASDYSAAEAPSIVLGICRYHRNGNGWNDIGYNALVDRFGTLYQGRAGGIQKAVVGAHAQGFNAETTSISSIGTHTTLPISAVARAAIVDYLAWKLTAHLIPATGKATLTSAGGEASRYESGKRVRLNRVIGHRDVGLTSCPGNAAYAILAKLRRQVQQQIDTGGGITPPPDSPPLPPPVVPPAPG